MVALLAFGLAASSRAVSPTDGARAVPIKAAYLLRMAQYVDWPAAAFASDGTPITIAVVDDDMLATELARISLGRLIGSRPIIVKAVNESDGIPPVQWVFIGDHDALRVKNLLHGIGSQSVLTVTDTDSGLDVGSVINFVLVGPYLRFEVSLDAAERNGLKLSSRLLSVAQRVRGKAQ
jgi:hypothetical protein